MAVEYWSWTSIAAVALSVLLELKTPDPAARAQQGSASLEQAASELLKHHHH